MIPAHMLAANRREERAASRSRVELRAKLVHHREVERKARDMLKDAIIAASVTPHAGTSILAAADSLRKAAVIAVLAERSESEPAAGGEP